jgi:hypothetical protein
MLKDEWMRIVKEKISLCSVEGENEIEKGKPEFGRKQKLTVKTNVTIDRRAALPSPSVVMLFQLLHISKYNYVK